MSFSLFSCSKSSEAYNGILSTINLTETRLTKVFVVGFLKSTTEQELTDLFSEYGPIKEVHIIRDKAGISKCFGFITFEHFDGAAAAIEEPQKDFQERQLHCKLASEENRPSNAANSSSNSHFGGGSSRAGGAGFSSSGSSLNLHSQSGPDGAMTTEEDLALRRIFCRNLSSTTTEESFKAFFSRFGETEAAQLAKHKDTGLPRGYGFVTYKSRVDAMRCLEAPVKLLDGNELSVISFCWLKASAVNNCFILTLDR